MPIDLNRGVEMRKSRASGIEVFMYLNEPGVYRSAHDKIIPMEIAAEAGYPVEALEKERKKRAAIATATQAIETEFNSASDLKNELVADAGGYKLIHIGLGRHNVTDADGNVLNSRPLTEQEGRGLYQKLAGKDGKLALAAVVPSKEA